MKKLPIILVLLLFTTIMLSPVNATNFNYTPIRIPAGGYQPVQPAQMIVIKANIIFKVDSGNFQWKQPKSWTYTDSFLKGETESTYKVTFDELHLISSNELAMTFTIKMRIAPPEHSAKFTPDWDESLNLNPEIKQVAKALASTSETYFDYIYKVYDFVSNYIQYDDNWLNKDPKDVNEIWENKRGVCRHYSMLMKAFLDYAGIKSLYSLGFLGYSQNGDDVVGVHMWLFVYDPANGWMLFDPTNNVYGKFTEFGYTYTYPMNFPVKITSDYVPYIYLPIMGVSSSQVQTLYQIISINTTGTIKQQELELKSKNIKFVFLRTIGAGNLLYIPISFYSNNKNIQTLKKYNYVEIPEYVPEDYVVPIGMSVNNLPSFYQNARQIRSTVDFNQYFIMSIEGNNLVVKDLHNDGLKLYLTDNNGRLVQGMLTKNGYEYNINKVGKLDGNELYLNIFGTLSLVKTFNINIKSITVTPVITIPTINGFESVIKIQTDPDLGDSLQKYLIVSGGSIEEWFGNNTVKIISQTDKITLKVGAKTVNVDLYNTNIHILTTFVEFKNSNTILNIQYDTNVGELIHKYDLNPLYIRIGKMNFPIDLTIDRDKASITTSITFDVLVNNDQNYYFITRGTVSKVFKLSFTYQIKELNAIYENGNIRVQGRIIVKPQGFSFDKTSLEQFSTISIIGMQKIGNVYTIDFTTDKISANSFTNPYKFKFNLFGRDIQVTYIFTVVGARISDIRIINYQITPEKTAIEYIMRIKYKKANANTPMVNYMYSRLLNFVKINNVKLPATYQPEQDYLIGYTSIPTESLLKLQKLYIFNIPINTQLKYKINNKYTDLKITFESLPLLGGMKCNVDHDYDIENNKLTVKFYIKTVYQPIVCDLPGNNTITIQPQVPFTFSVNLIDTSRIDDIDHNTGAIYSGYDGVYLTITTTALQMTFTVILDNKTLTTFTGGSTKVALPELNIGTHSLSIRDQYGIEVYRKNIIVEKQPLSLMLMHNIIWILVGLVVVFSIIIFSTLNKEDPLVSQAKLLFPSAEFIQKEKYGDYTYIYMMNNITGEIITVVFYRNRVVNVIKNKLFY